MTTDIWQEDFDYDTMPACIELDAMIAERIMGYEVSWWSIHPNTMTIAEIFAGKLGVWRPTVSFLSCWRESGYLLSSRPAEIMLPNNEGDAPILENKIGLEWHPIKHYSKNISSVWEVVEKTKNSGSFKTRWIQISTLSDGHYLVSVFAGIIQVGQGVAETAPLAICRAVLKAAKINDEASCA